MAWKKFCLEKYVEEVKIFWSPIPPHKVKEFVLILPYLCEFKTPFFPLEGLISAFDSEALDALRSPALASLAACTDL